MNLVAHQFLSFNRPKIQLGNLYGEIVRGKDYLRFEPELQKGILLHRKIDSFTDNHDVVKSTTSRFHKSYGKYAPVIVDVLYDYLLIKNWSVYHPSKNFDVFVEECYQLFKNHLDSFPSKLNYIVTHLLKYDWFHNYQTIPGIRQTLKGISQRSKFPNQIENAVEEIPLYLSEFEAEFHAYFPELIQHCKEFLER